MARVGFAAFIASLSGTVANAVFSRWKGRYYVRTRVIPANPNSALQQEVRTCITRLNALWDGIQATLNNAWRKAGSSAVVSGWNWFVHRNFANERATFMHMLCDVNIDVETILSWAGVAGGSSGDIDFTWAQGLATTGDLVIIYLRKDGTDALVDHTPGGAPAVEDELVTVTGLDPGAYYDCFATILDPGADGYSASVYDLHVQSNGA